MLLASLLGTHVVQSHMCPSTYPLSTHPHPSHASLCGQTPSLAGSGRSLFLFGEHSLPRRAAFAIVHHPVFEALVVAAILTNCTLLAMDNHSVRDGSALRHVLSTADVAFAAFFAAEMGLKLVALGGWGTGRGYVSVQSSSGSILSHVSRPSAVA
jgi:hypothetical protein